MVVRAAWLLPGGSGPGQTREDTRLAPVGTYAPESELNTRPGVIPGGDPFAATGAGAMTMQVGVGRAMVQGTTAQGAYPVAVTAPETLTFPDGDALNPRTDSVVLRVYDGLYDTSGDTLAVVERLPGTPAATPDPPALPVGCLRLWDVTVPAGASAGVGGLDWGTAVVDRRQYTAAVGGVIPAGGGLAFDGAYHGQLRDTGTQLERWDSGAGAWRRYPSIPARPVQTTQAADPPLNTTGAWVDFTAAAWPRLTFTVPSSGQVFITIGGHVENQTTASSTAWLTWRATGAYTEGHGAANAISAMGGRMIGSRRSLRQGLPVGGSVTIIPGWNVSSNNGSALIRSGYLTIEFVP